MPIKMHVVYCCDACGKKQGKFEDLNDNYSTTIFYGTLPKGWSIIGKPNIGGTNERLLCVKCTINNNRFPSDENTVVGDKYPL